MTGASILVTLLFIEFGYRKFIKKDDATDKVHPFSLYVADSLLGYKYNQPASYKVLNSFPNGDTVYNTAYTILEDTIHSGIHFNFRKGILDWADYNWFYKPLSDISRSKINRQFDILSRSGVQVIPVASIINMKDQKNFIPADGHPSAVANKAIANWLAEHITLSH